MWGLFPGTASLHDQSNKAVQLTPFVTAHRPWNINQVPIDYGFRPRLRGRLTLRGLTLRRNPWTCGESVSHTLCRYSCQHSRFRYLQGPSRDTPSQAYGTLRYRFRSQKTEVGCQSFSEASKLAPFAGQALQHLRDTLILIAPILPGAFVDVAQVQAVPDPNPHLIARGHGHR